MKARLGYQTHFGFRPIARRRQASTFPTPIDIVLLIMLAFACVFTIGLLAITVHDAWHGVFRRRPAMGIVLDIGRGAGKIPVSADD